MKKLLIISLSISIVSCTRLTASEIDNVFKCLNLFNSFVIIGILVFLCVIHRRTASERIKSIIFRSDKFNDELNKIHLNVPDALPQKLLKLNNEISRLQGEVEELNNVVAQLERLGTVSVHRDKTITQSVEDLPKVVTPRQVVYAKNFRAGVMTICDEREAQFKLSLATDDSATFEFCGDLESAKLNFDGTFDGVCNTEGLSIDATKYITTVLGQAAKCDDGWKVLSKSTVRFE